MPDARASCDTGPINGFDNPAVHTRRDVFVVSVAWRQCASAQRDHLKTRERQHIPNPAKGETGANEGRGNIEACAGHTANWCGDNAPLRLNKPLPRSVPDPINAANGFVPLTHSCAKVYRADYATHSAAICRAAKL